VTLKTVVLNPKGGSGKTTIATNLAAYYAAHGQFPALQDLDSQASSTRWLAKRTERLPRIHGMSPYNVPANVTRTFAMRIPPDVERIVVDTPAALNKHQLAEYTREADRIIVPVLPSDIDIQAVTRCIADLLLTAKIQRGDNRLAVVANRVKRNTVMFKSLMRFLDSLKIPVVAVLRDSQVYIKAAESGVGLHEMKGARLRVDQGHWTPLIDWLENGVVPKGDAAWAEVAKPKGPKAAPSDDDDEAANEPIDDDAVPVVAKSTKVSTVAANTVALNAVAMNGVAVNAVAVNAVAVNAVAVNAVAVNGAAAPGDIQPIAASAAHAVAAGPVASNAGAAKAVAVNAIAVNTVAANAVTVNEVTASGDVPPIAANAAHAVATNSVAASAVAAKAGAVSPVAANPVAVNAVAVAAVDVPAIAAKTIDVRAFAVKAVTAKVVDVPTVDVPALDVQAVNAKAVDASGTDAKAVDVTAGNVQAIDANAVDSKPADPAPADKPTSPLRLFNISAFIRRKSSN
jgi:chromosome partitioning protein